VSYAKLYYAILYKKPDDIFYELEEYNPELDSQLLVKISNYIPEGKEPMDFYMNNYQENINAIIHDYNKHIVSQKTEFAENHEPLVGMYKPLPLMDNEQDKITYMANKKFRLHNYPVLL